MTLWEKIESLYASKHVNNKLFLLNSIMSLKFKEDTSLLNHLNEFQRILDQMLGIDIKFEDEILGLLLLNSLPESWETFKGSVLNEEMRRKTQDFSFQSEGKKSKKRKKKIAEVNPSPNTRMCSVTTKHCFLWKKEIKGKKGKSKEKDHHDDDDDRVTTATCDDLVIFQDFELVNFVQGEHSFFTFYISGDFGVLKMGNDGVTKVIGDGDICLQTNMGVQLWLRRVKHAPDIQFNLIFVHMLNDDCYDNHFGYDENLPKEKNSKLYWTKALVAKDSVNVMDMEASL
ncbi:hypothetical protein CR513_09432, partial [Mucuna pruriens]